MRTYPWQLFVIIGVVFIAINLLIQLLLPIGVVLIVIGVILYFQSRSQAPKVIKK